MHWVHFATWLAEFERSPPSDSLSDAFSDRDFSYMFLNIARMSGQLN